MESRTIVRYKMLDGHFGGSYHCQFYHSLNPTATAVLQKHSVHMGTAQPDIIELCPWLKTIKSNLVKWQAEGGTKLPLPDFNELWLCHLSVLQQNAPSFTTSIYLVKEWWCSWWASLRNWGGARALNEAVLVWQNHGKVDMLVGADLPYSKSWDRDKLNSIMLLTFFRLRSFKN